MTGDPRLDPAVSADRERDTRPTVRRSGGGLPGWAVGVGAASFALVLFGLLDARRRSLEAPTSAVHAADATSLPPAVPELAIPAEPEPEVVAPPPVPVVAPPPSRPVVQAAPVIAAPVQRSVSLPPAQLLPAAPIRPTGAGTGGTPVVVDNSAPRSTANGSGNAASANASVVGSTDRARASMFANRGTTVPQGTLIPAVLETAFNSTRAGFARALVSRDVYGFDGTRVLIPRGSRLIGEYQSDTAPGQKRALVIWNRLIRPDGAVIAIASPAADPLGRGGVKASVNTHFLERFSGAILQSALDVGVNLASRSNNGTVVLAVPSTSQLGAGQLIRPTNIPPTLSVKPGVSISVFVARDLDFTDVETGR